MAFTPLLTKLRGQWLNAGGQVAAASGGLCSQGERDAPTKVLGTSWVLHDQPGDKARGEEKSCGKRGRREDAEPAAGKVSLRHALCNSVCSVSLKPRIE